MVIPFLGFLVNRIMCFSISVDTVIYKRVFLATILTLGQGSSDFVMEVRTVLWDSAYARQI